MMDLAEIIKQATADWNTARSHWQEFGADLRTHYFTCERALNFTFPLSQGKVSYLDAPGTNRKIWIAYQALCIEYGAPNFLDLVFNRLSINISAQEILCNYYSSERYLDAVELIKTELDKYLGIMDQGLTITEATVRKHLDIFARNSDNPKLFVPAKGIVVCLHQLFRPNVQLPPAMRRFIGEGDCTTCEWDPINNPHCQHAGGGQRYMPIRVYFFNVEP
ncbi:hypothetical protein JW930_01205 [Candidatus Woesearchaeota archaeon]|nr:hypothetical protein [Candidatus Woesearchaeota archaeon]